MMNIPFPNIQKTSLNRLFINNEQGRPIGVILSVEEYDLVKDVLESHFSEQQKIKELELAMQDARFLTDLQEAMHDFVTTDTEWWERTQ